MKERIEKLLSEILTDKYECKITLKFEKPTEMVIARCFTNTIRNIPKEKEKEQ